MANDNMNFGGNGISATDHDHAGQGAFPESLVTDSTAATYHTNWLHEKTSHEASGLSPANPYIFFCGAWRRGGALPRACCALSRTAPAGADAVGAQGC